MFGGRCRVTWLSISPYQFQITSSPPSSVTRMDTSPPRTLNLSTKLRTLPIQITPTTSQVCSPGTLLEIRADLISGLGIGMRTNFELEFLFSLLSKLVFWNRVLSVSVTIMSVIFSYSGNKLKFRTGLSIIISLCFFYVFSITCAIFLFYKLWTGNPDKTYLFKIWGLV